MRLLRQSRWLRACVTDIEVFVEQGYPTHPGMIPEPVVGQLRFLFGIRQECRDLASETGRHPVRLRWPDGYLGRTTLAGRRCEAAHHGLQKAAEALALAACEYERMFGTVVAQQSSESAPAALLGLPEPLRLLDPGAAAELAGFRDSFAEGIRIVSDVLYPGDRRNNTIDATWPIYRSEIVRDVDHYQGDVRPLAWTGMGDQPITHVDAQ
jgi:hypothetical protein